MDERPMHIRTRLPEAAELAGIHWLEALLPADRERAVAALRVGDAQPGDYVCRIGKPVNDEFA